MPGYGGIAELNDLAIGQALGLIGGLLPHESHPLEAGPLEIKAPIGQTVEGKLIATAGVQPYTFAVDGTAPMWIIVGSDGTVAATPPPGTAIEKIEIAYTVTDAGGVEVSSTLVIDVVDAP